MASKNVVEIILRAVNDTDKGVKGAKDGMDSLSKSALVVGGAFVAVGAAAVTAFGYAAMKQMEAADAMGKMAQKAGTTVSVFSSLAYAAKQSDVSTETLTKGLGKLSVAMVSAQSGTGSAKEAFDLLGVSVTNSNGSLKSSEVVFKSISEKLSGLKDGAQKTDLAIKLFGKSGADLLPLMNEGAAGISNLQARAKELGLVISDDLAKNSEIFNDALADIKATGEGVMNQFIAKMAPYLAELAQWFADQGPEIITWVNNFINDLQSCSAEIGMLVNIGKTVGVVLMTAFELVGDRLARIGAIIFNLVQGQFKEAYNIIADTGSATVEIIARNGKKIGDIWTKETIAQKKELKTREKQTKESLEIQQTSFLQALIHQNDNSKKWEAMTGNEKIANTKSTLGTISGLMSSHNTVLFNMGKAAAIANATIDTISGVTKALATYAWPYSMIVAALVGTAGAVQIANIASTSPPQAFETGGIVAGTSFTGDRVHALVNSGELIMNKAQQDSIAGQLNNSGPITVVLELGDKVLSQTFNRLSNQGQLKLRMV